MYLLTTLGLKRHQRIANWVTREDVRNFMQLAGFEPVIADQRILCPLHIPVISTILNKFLAPYPPFTWLCLTNWMVGRLPVAVDPKAKISIVCPCRNEEGNIFSICRRMPDLGCDSELIFIEGNSCDDTLKKCMEAQGAFPNLDISVFQQTGKGKGDAVRLGFDKSRHDILIILDADMTVKPEDLPLFVEALKSGICEFVNGSRLVYAMEDKAMRFLNLVGNKFFSVAFTFLLGQPIKDTLCGTKVLLKSDYQRLAKQRDFFGDFDPFGDFDLLFGASKLGLKIMDLPVHYQARTYGTTQISRFSHGFLLVRMCGVGLAKLKMR
jgi:glycosyltransferase involved in cell wall biosynthesis